jgi:hypothetical protein
LKRRYDEQDPASLRLRELAGRPILSWPVTLPDRDRRGVPSAGKFRCWKKASASTKGIAGSYFSIKSGGMTAVHSFLEAKLLAFFEMCPFVVEVRTQYPSWDRDEYLKFCSEDRPFPKNKIMTIDFMLTLQIPGIPYLIYHGVSGKPLALLDEQSVVGRHGREANQLWRWGGTHEVMTEHSVSKTEYVNYKRMLSYMVHTDDIGRYAVSAAVLARALKATSARGDMNRVLGMVAKRFGWDLNTGYRLFAIANFLGYLSWNHDYRLWPRNPMMLAVEG